MKQLTARTADDSAALPALPGSLSAGQTLIQDGLLKNTGDEPLNSIRLWLTNMPGLPGVLSASVNGLSIPEASADVGVTPQAAIEVLAAPLAPGASLALTLTWTAPADLTLTGLDSATLNGTVS